MIHASKVMNAIINAGLTYSPEAGDPFPMRQVPCADVANVVVRYLAEAGVDIESDLEPRHSQPTQFYYSKRAEWYRQEAERSLQRGEALTTYKQHLKRAEEYSVLAGELPTGDDNA